MIHSNPEQQAGLVEALSPTCFHHGAKDDALSSSMLPVCGLGQRSIDILLSPIATPKNPIPSFRVMTDKAAASKIPPGVEDSSASKALRLSFLRENSTETKAATFTFGCLLYASTIYGSGHETTSASDGEVYVTPSAGSAHGSGPITARQWIPTNDQKSPVRIRISTIVRSTLKRKGVADGPKKTDDSRGVIDANTRSYSGKRSASLAPHLQKATSNKRQDVLLDRQSTTQCRCKRSRCLKKYCQCFLIDARCNRACGCINCGNGDDSRGVIDANTRSYSGKRLASLALHFPKATSNERQYVLLDRQSMTQCRCKRSRCLKKYCQCFLVDARCNRACGCINCGNNDL